MAPAESPEEAQTLLNRVPVEAREYFTAGDGLGLFAVHERYPHVDETLKAPSTREAVVNYLASEEPLHDNPNFTAGALSYLQAGANVAELARIHHLVKHPAALIRLRTYEYMMTIAYAPRDTVRITRVCQEMLADPDESVRVQAVRWIQGNKLEGSMQPVLVQWSRFANERGWAATESYSLMQRLIADGKSHSQH